MTTAIAEHNLVDQDARDDLLLAVASINAGARRRNTVLVESRPHWRLTEAEIVRASITVILVALVTVIGVSAGAILTMG
ncbi:hypothetical protein AWC29_21665 [Mycobacterium triplex]|uniref:Transmembrane protein n=1 Tax=Mycobacterium triplex TaxID=47839 RepID=A0A024JZC0_9MYCO|nr:hypothetical protein [Mycobacterium triplex]ORX01812.1 hypothetical protein AWC29_21665 [Mycobacterium triplex]CDO89011.1 hypothetical protein BN973_03382 [Mycobacterium triplex]